MKAKHLHEAMMNSFNIITNKITYDDLFKMERTFLVHVPDEPITLEDIDIMIGYFEQLEMYENCAELKVISDEILNYDEEEEDYEEDSCECKIPIISSNDGDIRCLTCDKKFKWWR